MAVPWDWAAQWDGGKATGAMLDPVDFLLLRHEVRTPGEKQRLGNVVLTAGM